jgi:hypothetical protein
MQSPAMLVYEMPPTPESRSPSRSPVVSPMNIPAAPIHAPQPATTFASRQVFERYDRGRVTPDLVVRRKINTWGAQPSFR